MARNKIGFHLGPAGNPTGIGDYMSVLDNAGIPMVIKSVDHYGYCFEASQYQNANHVIVFRLSTAGQNDGFDYDVPKYNLEPEDAARIHWQSTLAKLPPEFDKGKVWLEVINEPDHDYSDWLGEFGYHIGQKALEQGYKVAMFGFSAGEPEIEDWHTEGMRRYLQLCAQHPGQLCVALHEYSLTIHDITNMGMIGRFQQLLYACDVMGITRPNIIITEWGWEYDEIPEPHNAMIDVDWSARLYGRNDEVIGAAMWYLGGGFSEIHNQTQKLILPVALYTTQNILPGDDDPPPPLPPPANENNMITNNSFEGSWWHKENKPEYQIPVDFDIEVQVGENEFDPEHGDYVEPEIRVLPREQLPEDEQDLFILEGDQTVKIFKSQAPIKVSFFTTVDIENPGIYTLEVPVFPDLVMRYENGVKVYADDPFAGMIRLVRDGHRGDWILPAFGLWDIMVFDLQFDEPAENVVLGVELHSPFPLLNNGWFTDQWVLRKTSDIYNERQYKRVVHLLPQDISVIEWEQAVKIAVPKRQTMTFSMDDAFIDHENLTERLVYVWNVERILGNREALENWVMEHYPPIPTIEYRRFFSRLP